MAERSGPSQADQLAEMVALLAKGQVHYFWYWRPLEGQLVLAKQPQSLFGESGGQTLNGWQPLLAPADLPKVETALAQSTPDSPDCMAMLHVRGNGGKWRQVEWRLRATQWNAAGQVGAAVGVLRDAQGEEAGSAAGEIGQRLAAAERASREKNLFLANISHDIRTPINAILGLASLTATTALSREQSEYLRLIRTSAESVVGILSNVLDFSRIEVGCLELDPVDFSPRRMLSDTLRALAFEAQQKGLEVVLTVAPEVPDYVRGDATRIKQIVTNLFQNAVKFTARGEISVIVSLVASAGSEMTLAIAVQDTGCGIPETVIGKIFDAYSQADASIARQYGGSGLGLSICRRLTELMHGSLRVESVPDQGSRFIAELVCATARDGGAAHQPSAGLGGQQSLVVCAHPGLAASIVDILCELGMTATVVADLSAGHAAMEEAGKHCRPIDWVFVDFPQLVAADGEQLAAIRKLRQKGMLAITGVQHSIDDLPPAIRCSVDGSLLKPLVSLDIVEALTVVQQDGGDFLSPPNLDADVLMEPVAAKKRILIAEDNPVSRRVTTMLLEKAGYLVDAVCDGKEAVDRLADHRFPCDLVIMDLQMPRLDGIAATQAIRMHEMRRSWVMDFDWRQLPVIGLTGDVTADTLKRCLAAGMTRVLTKPVRPDALIEVIAEVLSRKQSAPDHQQMGEMAILIQSQINPSQVFPGAKRVSQEDWIPADEAVAGASGRDWYGWNMPAFEQLAADFFAGLAEISPVLANALNSDNRPAFDQAISRLRGLLGRLHAEDALAAVSRLEDVVREGQVGERDAAFSTLMNELNDVSTELRTAAGV